MLVVFWVTSTWSYSGGLTAKAADFLFVLSLVLFFGTFIAIPVIAYSFAADFVANYLREPWNLLAYIALILGGCAAYGAVLSLGSAPPPRPNQWLHIDWPRYVPIMTTSSVLLLYRLQPKRG